MAHFSSKRPNYIIDYRICGKQRSFFSFKFDKNVPLLILESKTQTLSITFWYIFLISYMKFNSIYHVSLLRKLQRNVENEVWLKQICSLEALN